MRTIRKSWLLLLALAGTSAPAATLWPPDLNGLFGCAAPFPIAERLGRRTPGVSVALDGTGVLYRMRRHVVLAPEYDPILDTLRFRSGQERVPRGSRFLMPLLHGFGADYSHAGSMLAAMRVLLSPGHPLGEDEPGYSLARTLQAELARASVAAEAIDLPWSGGGPDDPALGSLDRAVEWLAMELRQLRLLAPDVPLVPLGRSGSTGLLLSVVQRYPDLVDGLILVSPGHPTIAFDEYVRLQERLIGEGDFVPNRVALERILGLYRQMRTDWAAKANPFGKVPTFVLTGAKDDEQMPGWREKYAEYVAASKADGIVTSEFWNVPQVGHDVVNVGPGRPSVRVYRRLLEFLERLPRRR